MLLHCAPYPATHKPRQHRNPHETIPHTHTGNAPQALRPRPHSMIYSQSELLNTNIAASRYQAMAAVGYRRSLQSDGGGDTTTLVINQPLLSGVDYPLQPNIAASFLHNGGGDQPHDGDDVRDYVDFTGSTPVLVDPTQQHHRVGRSSVCSLFK